MKIDEREGLFIWVEPAQTKPTYMAIINDFMFWENHKEELYEWCNQYSIKVEGLTMMFPDEKTYVLTKMRWK